MNIEKNARIAFLGEAGAFSEEAAMSIAGDDARLIPCASFDASFTSVAEGAADYVLSPVENSLVGSIQRSLDLLIESDLAIVAEVVLPIVHNLIAMPGASFEQIEFVESHPVALAQCEGFFRSHPWLKRVTSQNTAGSVRDIMRSGDSTRAAIAGYRAAAIHNANILREHLEDNPENYTRFLLLTPASRASSAGNKLSLVFHLDQRPGALFNALEPFACRRINLVRIESRPIHGRPWEYLFYLDLHASLSDQDVSAALEELQRRAAHVRVLGCYQAAENCAGKLRAEMARA
jgi:prephenate dehydratase